MQTLKHVGRIKSTGRRCLVVFRTLPGDAFSCLVIQTESLDPSQHDSLISLVESNAAQAANEFSEVLARALFGDGSTMLPSLHARGLLAKFPTDAIEMVPNMQATILLSELNQVIAQQAGVSVQDLAIRPSGKENLDVQELAKVKDISPKTGNTEPLMEQYDAGKTTSATVNEDGILTDDLLAKKYRSDADRLSKEAAQLRRMAEELVPTKKKTAIEE
jgi:hypothetical protein